ncbi:MAG: hypothetical protein JSS32_03290 [Verrucomicrobia bacterium]|nr:hypothetical protein [Verrucomicrobiota bacterium]
MLVSSNVNTDSVQFNVNLNATSPQAFWDELLNGKLENLIKSIPTTLPPGVDNFQDFYASNPEYQETFSILFSMKALVRRGSDQDPFYKDTYTLFNALQDMQSGKMGELQPALDSLKNDPIPAINYPDAINNILNSKLKSEFFNHISEPVGSPAYIRSVSRIAGYVDVLQALSDQSASLGLPSTFSQEFEKLKEALTARDSTAVTTQLQAITNLLNPA